MTTALTPGTTFPDFELRDDAGVPHRLSELQGSNPMQNLTFNPANAPWWDDNWTGVQTAVLLVEVWDSCGNRTQDCITLYLLDADPTDELGCAGARELWSRMDFYQQKHGLGRASVAGNRRPMPYPPVLHTLAGWIPVGATDDVLKWFGILASTLTVWLVMIAARLLAGTTDAAVAGTDLHWYTRLRSDEDDKQLSQHVGPGVMVLESRRRIRPFPFWDEPRSYR